MENQDTENKFPVNYASKQSCIAMTSKPLMIKNSDSLITCLALDKGAKYLAVGGFDGSIRIYSPLTGKLTSALYNPSKDNDDEVFPSISCLRFKPQKQSAIMMGSQTLMATTSDGIIMFFSLSSMKITHVVEDQKVQENEICSGDYTCDGNKFVVGGLDRKLHVYDDYLDPKTFIKAMGFKNLKLPMHGARIKCIKGHPTDPNLVISSGWDNTMKIYDIELGGPIHNIGGPKCTGDSIDFYGDMILTGSDRNHNEMALYSLKHKKEIFTWSFGSKKDQHSEGG